MELLVLNQDLQTIGTLDSYESLIWTERYWSCGDFEIFAPVDDFLLTMLIPGNYIWSNESSYLMIIESRQINTDSEIGSRLTVTGRSLESILDRRIIWTETTITGSVQEGIERLLNENAVNPVNPDRTIPNLIFVESSDPLVTSLTVDTWFHGETLYDAIQLLCDVNSIGFKMVLFEGAFMFELYSGVDRSYEQTDTPYVVFSPGFDNLLTSNYLESATNLKNVALVQTETLAVEVGIGEGLQRREIFSEVYAEDAAQVEQQGMEILNENIFITSFEGQVDTTKMFMYGQDFFMGDIVQVENEFGLEGRSRVTEIVRTQNLSGVYVYPTFTTV